MNSAKINQAIKKGCGVYEVIEALHRGLIHAGFRRKNHRQPMKRTSMHQHKSR